MGILVISKFQDVIPIDVNVHLTFKLAKPLYGQDSDIAVLRAG